MSEWREVALDECCEILSSKRIFAHDYVEEGVPFYRSKEIIEKAHGKFFQDEIFITHERFNDIKSKFGSPVKGDLLISAVGNRSGIPYCVKEDYDFYFKDGNLIWFRNFNHELNSEYLEHYLNSNTGQSKLESFMIGSAQKALTITGIKKIKINLPPLPEQKAIAHILGKLDDKIELNRQVNQTLEEMAQVLFTSWFVDFDPVFDNALAAGNEIPEGLKAKAERRTLVPDEEKLITKNPELAKLFPSTFTFNETLEKWIPEGWEVKRADEVSDISIGKTPPRKEQHWFEDNKTESNYIWVSIKNMGSSGMYISDSDEYLTAESVSKFNVNKVQADTVILSFKMTVGRVAITTIELCTNEAIAHFSNPKKSLFSGYIYQYLNLFNYDELGSTSSIANAVNSKLLKQMPFLVPNDNVLKQFEKSIKNINGQVLSYQKQTETLTQLRDTLLPQLISGKVRVPEGFVERMRAI